MSLCFTCRACLQTEYESAHVIFKKRTVIVGACVATRIALNTIMRHSYNVYRLFHFLSKSWSWVCKMKLSATEAHWPVVCHFVGSMSIAQWSQGCLENRESFAVPSVGDIPKLLEWNTAQGLYTGEIEFTIKCSTNQSTLNPTVWGRGCRGLFLRLTNNCLWLNLVSLLFIEQICFEIWPIYVIAQILWGIFFHSRPFKRGGLDEYISLCSAGKDQYCILI